MPPSPLITFIETIDLNKVWEKDIGKGADDSFSKIKPNISDDQIFIADIKGNISAIDINTGKFIWRNDSSLSITGGPGIGDTLVLVGIAWNGSGAILLSLNNEVKWLWLPALVIGSLIGGYFGAHYSILKGEKIVKKSFEILTLAMGSSLIIKVLFS